MNTIILILSVYITWRLVKKGVSFTKAYLDGENKWRSLFFGVVLFWLSYLALTMAGFGVASLFVILLTVRFTAPGLITEFLSTFERKKKEKVGESE